MPMPRLWVFSGLALPRAARAVWRVNTATITRLP
jgi:hypothetical protein